jgi:hypothetical protein
MSDRADAPCQTARTRHGRVAGASAIFEARAAFARGPYLHGDTSFYEDTFMKLSRVLLLTLALGAFALPSSAGVVGKALPAIELEGYAQTKARSLDDFVGRAVLVEFFAYW